MQHAVKPGQIVASDPALTTIRSKSVNELVLLEFNATATDADNDTLIFSLETGAPSGASITPTGDFSWMPAADPAGSHDVTVTVTDDTESVQFIDQRRAQLVLSKSTDKDDTFEFVLTDTDTNEQSTYTLTTVDGSASRLIDILAGHNYRIEETDIPDNFSLTKSRCLGTMVSGTNFTVSTSNSVFCHFTNNFTEPGPESDGIELIGTITSHVNGTKYFSKPTDVVTNPITNNTYVLNSVNNTITILEHDGTPNNIDTVVGFINHNSSINFLEIDHIGNDLYYIDTDLGSLIQYDLDTNTKKSIQLGDGDGDYEDLKINVHSNTIFTLRDTGIIDIINLNNYAVNTLNLEIFKGNQTDIDEFTSAIAVHPETNILYVAAYIHDPDIYLINGTTGEHLGTAQSIHGIQELFVTTNDKPHLLGTVIRYGLGITEFIDARVYEANTYDNFGKSISSHVLINNQIEYPLNDDEEDFRHIETYDLTLNQASAHSTFSGFLDVASLEPSDPNAIRKAPTGIHYVNDCALAFVVSSKNYHSLQTWQLSFNPFHDEFVSEKNIRVDTRKDIGYNSYHIVTANEATKRIYITDYKTDELHIFQYGAPLCFFEPELPPLLPVAVLNVTKSANADATFGFALTDTDTNEQSTYTLTTVDGSASRLIDILAGHNYRIEETDIPDNFSLTGSECIGDAAVNGTAFAADQDGTVLCHFENLYAMPVAVLNVTKSANADATFGFALTDTDTNEQSTYTLTTVDGSASRLIDILAGHNYRIEETDIPDNFSLTGSECIGDAAVNGTAFAADQDGTVLCHFENLYAMPVAVLNVTKSANADATFGFALTDTDTNEQSTYTLTTVDGSASRLIDILAGHNYRIEETDIPDNFSLTGSECIGDAAVNGTAFAADQDGTVLCHFENLYAMPVAVLNVTKSANADATFGFALTDTDTNEQSTYTLTTVDGSASRLIDILAGHNYRIEETDIPDNFSLTGSECIGDAAVNGTAFAADQDGTVLCHFENLYAMPVAVLNVTKSANADATFGFALTDTDTNEQSTYTLTTVDGSASRLIDILAGHNYRIEETDIPDNFSLTGSECIGDAAVNGTAFAADQDGTVLCHFENLYAMPVAVLNVTKSANADATFGFALTDTDTNEQSTYTLTTVDGSASRLIDILAGHNYRIEETDIPDNFSLTGSECIGDAAVNGTAFAADQDGTVLCHFENLYAMPVAVLNVTKSANADATFGFALTDTDTNEQSTYTLTTVDGSASRLIDILAGHNYRIEETDIPDNFSLTGSECIGDAAVNGTAFAADQDGTVLCHFENLYAMPVAVLNVTKSANADATFGFALTDTDTNEQSTYTLTTVDGSASRLIDILAGHNYRIEETDIPDNFSLTGSECIGDAAVNGTAFAADQDGTVLCHFENLYAMPVAVLNVTKSANADATFGFALTDTDTNEQSTYTLTTVDGSASRLIDILAGHNYRIEETDIPDNFSLTGSECIGDAAVNGTAFAADQDGTVLCHFENLYAMPVAVLNVTKSANADATFGFALTDTDTNEQSTYTLTTVDGSASRLIDILAGHNYRIEETDIPDNFSLTGSECIGDAAVNGTAFAADQDGTVLCHFENLYAMPVAVLNVTKSANADATFGFALTDTDTNEQSTYTLTTVDGSASRLIDILAGHNYRIEETDIPDNFSLTGSECIGDAAVNGTAFAADQDGTVLCHFENLYAMPVAVLNVTKSANADATFGFALTDTDTNEQSTYTLTTVDGSASRLIDILAGHNYRIEETDIPDNFSLTGSECIGDAAVNGTAFAADQDGTVLCHFENLYAMPVAVLNVTKSANADATFGFAVLNVTKCTD